MIVCTCICCQKYCMSKGYLGQYYMQYSLCRSVRCVHCLATKSVLLKVTIQETVLFVVFIDSSQPWLERCLVWVERER